MKNEVMKNKTNLQNDKKVDELADSIVQIVTEARASASKYINTALVMTYWKIGQYIVEFEQGGNSKSKYGSSLLTKLAKILTARLGSGFSRPNLNNMRKFYLTYSNCQMISNKLNWSQICELITIDDNLERSFYEKECIKENWNVKALRRQMDSGLFLRLAASKDKEGILALAEKGVEIQKPEDIGQMNMYMGYFANEENEPDDNPPVGIILSRNKDELLVEYATYGMDSNLFVSKYELYLPNREELKKLVSGILDSK